MSKQNQYLMVLHEFSIKKMRNLRQIQDLVSDGNTDPSGFWGRGCKDAVRQIVQAEVGVGGNGNDASSRHDQHGLTMFE